MPNETNKDRYSIAFNIIPKGEFGDTTMKLYLQYKTKKINESKKL